MSSEPKATDWDAYYRAVPSYTSVTRRISAAKLARLFRQFIINPPVSFCELGGANSCFVEGLGQALPIKSYHVIDLNELGLSLLGGKRVPFPLTHENGDVLQLPKATQDNFDVVYSVGLIEHFDREGTAAAIASHFAVCRPGGLVLITFPTPTAPYRAIRAIAEMTGKWSFHDERPLGFSEVLATAEKHGELLHRSINWMIGLTQGYVVLRKPDA